MRPALPGISGVCVCDYVWWSVRLCVFMSARTFRRIREKTTYTLR